MLVQSRTLRATFLFAVLISLLPIVAISSASPSNAVECYVVDPSDQFSIIGPGTCTGEITIPDEITSIATGAFDGNVHPNSVTKINFNVTSALETISSSAFSDSPITEIYIPPSVTYIGSYAFTWSALQKITFDPDSQLTSIEPGVFDNSSIYSIILPVSVKSIGAGAFNRSGLASITLPSGLETIGANAFASNLGSSLESITIPSSVTSIGDNAFSGSALTSITFIDPTLLDFHTPSTLMNVIHAGTGGVLAWNDAANGTGFDYTSQLQSDSISFPSGAITLHALWTHTVTLKNNYDVAITDETQTSFMSTSLKGNSYVRSGYSFEKWNTKADGSGTSYLDLASYPFATDQNLYAQWTPVVVANRSVTYVLGYEGGTAPTQAPVAQGSSFVVAADPVRADYLFTGWSAGSGGIPTEGTVYRGPSVGAPTNFTVGGTDVVLTANWESTKHPIVRQLFNSTSGSNELWTFFGGSRHTGLDVVPGWCAVVGSGINPSTWVVKSVTHQSQSESFVFSNSITVGGGGYSLSPDPSIFFTSGETQSVNLGTAIANTAISNTRCEANLFTIYPKLPSPLSFDTSTGTISGTPTAAQSNTAYTLTAERWVDINGDLDLAGTRIGYSTATFNLEVLAPHTVTYLGGEGSSGTAPLQGDVATDESFTIANNTFTKAGYTFMHWILGENEATLNPSDSYTASTTDIYLTASWSADPHTITYLSGNALGSVPTQSAVTTGNSFIVASASGLTKVGSIFRAWNDGRNDYAVGDSYTVFITDETLTALWTAINYLVTFKTDGGSPVSQITFNFGNSISAPTPPTKSGYQFLGWSLSEYGSRINFPYTPTRAANLILFASWVKNPPVAVNQSPLSISNSSLTVTVGQNVKISTQGGSGSGVLTFIATGSGCSMLGNILSASRATTCIVIAYKAASTGYLAATSPSKSFVFTYSARTPTFSKGIKTATTFGFQITNYSADFQYAISTNRGTITRGTPTLANLPITISGLNASTIKSLVVTVTVTRVGYQTGTGSIKGSD